MEAYPFAHAVHQGTGVVALYERLCRDGALVLPWTAELPDTESPVVGDRPAAAVVAGAHSTVRTLTCHAAATFNPTSRSFEVALGEAPHLLRDMHGLTPTEALEACAAPGFCTRADTGTQDTACHCAAVIEAVTVEQARIQTYKTGDDAQFAASLAVSRGVLENMFIAPTLAMRRTGATGQCAVLRNAWWTPRQYTAYACDAIAGAGAGLVFPCGGAPEPARGAVDAYRGRSRTAAETQRAADPLPYRDTHTTLTALNAAHDVVNAGDWPAPRPPARVVIFRLPYGIHEPLVTLARMEASSASFVAAIAAAPNALICLRLACRILELAPSTMAASCARTSLGHGDPVPDDPLVQRVLRDLKATHPIGAIREACLPAAGDGGAGAGAGERAAAPRASDTSWRRHGGKSSGAESAAAVDPEDAQVLGVLNRLQFHRDTVIAVAGELRDALYPTWDARRRDILALHWNVSELDTKLIGSFKETRVFLCSTVRVRVRFVHCPTPAPLAHV